MAATDGNTAVDESIINGIINNLNTLFFVNLQAAGVNAFIQQHESVIFNGLTGDDVNYNTYKNYIQNILVQAQQKLFAYGTLQPGEKNYHVVEWLDGSWRAGFVIGSLVDYGWGAKGGFPAFSFKGNDTIYGQLLTSNKLPTFWPALDNFEGGEYKRVLIKVHCGDATHIAFIYAANV